MEAYISYRICRLKRCAMETLGSELKHYLNPLHVYCRLRDIGLSKCGASVFCRIYERVFFKRFVCRQSAKNT